MKGGKMLENHITKKEALKRIRNAWSPLVKRESVDIEEASGRILAEDYYARYSLPVVRAAGMDGIAVNFDMFAEGMPDTSKWTRGQEYERVDTGDDFDDRYDTVIPIEWVKEAGSGIILTPSPMGGPRRRGNEKQPDEGMPAQRSDEKAGAQRTRKAGDEPLMHRGMNVRPSGSIIEKGAAVGRKGMRITPIDIAALATGGHSQVQVLKKPVITFIPTGSELVPAGSEIKRGENFDANSPMAAAMLRELGAEVVRKRIIWDDYGELKKVLADALAESDMVLINGGSSKGEEDFNTRLLAEKGKLIFHWVKAAPGRPMSAAVINGRLAVNLAGPTLAAYYGIIWCVRELISDWYGRETPFGFTVRARLENDLPSPPLSLIMRMNVKKDADGCGYLASPASMAGGNRMNRDLPGGKRPGINMPDANGLFITDPDSSAGNKKGDEVEIILVRQ